MLRIYVATVLTLVSTGTLTAENARPNVVVVMTDDQGYGELSCHGNPVLQTPHLDQLYEQSLRFTDYHAAPMCTPTRGQFLTGRDAARNGAINVSSGRTLLRPELPTIADLFAEAGYRTGLFGKWHVGDNYPFRPGDRGFHDALWFPSSHINSVPDQWNNDYFNDIYNFNGEKKQFSGYCTDVFFEEAIKWMNASAKSGKPFMLFLPTNAPHQPHWVPAKYREEMERLFTAERYPNLDPELRKKIIRYLGMIRNIDDNMGRLEAFLQESGLAKNTILVFTTDNGSTFGKFYYPCGMRGRKTDLWEGGHRVPLFVRWPDGNLGQPRDLAGLAQSQDLLPTLLDLCGITEDVEFDGISLAPAMRGGSSIPEDRMLVINYSRMPFEFDYPSPDSQSRMRRKGAGVLWKRWRLLQDRELYDLDDDPMQQKNVIGQHPEIAAKMRAKLDAWWDSVKEVANEPQRVIIGSDRENPSLLTACEWLDVFVDQQIQVRRADRKNGWWELEVAQEGEYEFELRRWPRESGLALAAPAPADVVADGVLEPGLALPIHAARITIDGNRRRRELKSGDQAAQFTIRLKKGPTRLYTWFYDERDEPICGAYYVYVKRK